jgi:hypothetical protein
MNTMDAQPVSTRPNNRWGQYSLRTLLVMVALAAALCSIARHVGWLVPAGILVAVAIGAVVGRLVTRTDLGLGTGVIRGLQLSLVAVFAMTAYCVYRGYFCDSGEWRWPHKASEIPSTAEMMRAVRREYPTARRMPETSKLATLLSGHYDMGPGLSGENLYLFPDGTYLDTQWADIFPETICDEGSWGCQDGWVVLRTDGPKDNGPRMFLPLTARLNEVRWGDRTDRESPCLFYALWWDWPLGPFKMEQTQTSDIRFLPVCLVMSEPIAKSGANAIREMLYERYAPAELRWRRRSGKYALASVYMIAVLVAARILASRPRTPETPLPNAGELEMHVPEDRPTR